MKRLYNHNFPMPSYLAMDSFSIDISDQSVKFGELVVTSSGLRLGRYGKEKIPAGVVVSGKIEKEDELVKVLKNLKEREKLNFIRVSLPEEQMYLFTLSIPKTNGENIRDMILLQIEEHIPLKAPDSIFDYDVVSMNNQNILVEVVAIAGATIDGYLSVFDKAGLIPLSFEIEAQAIARAVIPDGDDKPVMIVDFGETRTGVSIALNGRVFLTTTLSMGGVDLTNMIAKNFSLSFDEAEKMKHEYGLNTNSKVQDIFPAILNGISVLRDELNKQYLYWDNHNDVKNEKINHIILCGGDANLTGLAEYLELSMKIKVENANVWVNILKTENAIPEMSFEESLSYATVLGLALGSYSHGTQSIINILPEAEKRILKKEYWMRFFIVFMNLIALMGILAIILLFPSYFISKSEEKIVKNRLEVFNTENPELITNNMDKKIKEINSKLEIIDKSKALYQVSDDVIDNILSNKTEGITFSQILYSKKVVETPVVSKEPEVVDIENDVQKKVKTEKVEFSALEVHGTAKDRDSLRNFKTALDSNPSFKEVNLPISNFLEKKDLVFTVSIIMK